MSTSISFPSSPSVGQEYTYGSTTYKWTGSEWEVTGSTEASQVTYENLNANGDVGTGSSQVAVGNDSRFTNTRTPTDSTVSPSKLDDEFKTTVALTGTVVDWSVGMRFTKTITAATTLTFSNLHVGTKLIEVSGNFAVTLPTTFVYAGGSRASSGSTLIQVICTTISGTGWYILLKDES